MEMEDARLNSLLQKLGRHLSVFNHIYHMLDQKSLISYFNGLVLPDLDYADIVWGEQPGTSYNTDETITIFSKSLCKEDRFKLKMSSAEALMPLRWVSLHARRFGHWCCVVRDAMKGSIPEHFSVFRSTMNQQHSTVTIPEMATCPNSVGQERNGEKAKHIIKPLTTGPQYQVH